MQHLLSLTASRNTKQQQSPSISCIPDLSPILSESSLPTSEYSNSDTLRNHSATGMDQFNKADAITVPSALQNAKRKRISLYQYNRLMETFESTDTPSSVMREKLAKELDMTKREVQVKYAVICWSLKPVPKF